MKIILCGKGGAGKSTLVSLIARQFSHTGKKVVVVDTDASNTGLHYLLGTDEPQDFIGNFSDKKSMMDEMRKLRQNRTPTVTPMLGTWTFDTLPEKCTAQNDCVKLVTMGKIQKATEFGKGRWVGLTRQFLTGYIVSDLDRVIIDTDAGVEHFARGMGGFCDMIIAIIDTSYESTLFVKTISRMAVQAELPLYFILNKTIPSLINIRNAIPDSNLIIGELPMDRTIQTAGLKGYPVSADYQPIKDIVEGIERIIMNLKTRQHN